MLSTRASALEPSPTLEITAKARALRERGADILSFGAGEPDFDTPGHIKEALYKAVEEGFTRYTQPAGIPELREEISRKLERENRIRCSPEEIIVTPGAKQALFEAILALAEPGVEVLVPEPRWVSYLPMIRIAGATPVPVPTSSERGFKLEASDVERRLSERSKLLILNSPNNPTGAVIEEKELKGIAELCIEHDLMVIADEIYERIVYDAEHRSMASLPDMKERTITVNGFSKAYSMTGWRLGYAAGPEHIIKAMSKIQAHSVSNATSFVQKAGVAALSGSQRCVEEMVREFKKRRDRIVELLNEMDGVKCSVPQGAFYAFPDFSSVEESSMKLASTLLEEAKVAVVPGIAFGESGEGHLRFSYATGLEKIEEGMERVGAVVRRMS